MSKTMNPKKREKLIKQIKKKQDQVRNIEEDIKKMAKLALKDGKLQKVAPEPQSQEPMQAPIQAPMPPVEPQGFPQEVMGGEQQMAQNYQQPVQPQASVPVQQQYQQPVQQPVQQHQPAKQQPPQVVTVIVSMINGDNIQVEVPLEQMEQFLSEIAEAINAQQSLSLGNQVVNGRHIVKYVIG